MESGFDTRASILKLIRLKKTFLSAYQFSTMPGEIILEETNFQRISFLKISLSILFTESNFYFYSFSPFFSFQVHKFIWINRNNFFWNSPGESLFRYLETKQFKMKFATEKESRGENCISLGSKQHRYP